MDQSVSSPVVAEARAGIISWVGALTAVSGAAAAGQRAAQTIGGDLTVGKAGREKCQRNNLLNKFK